MTSPSNKATYIFWPYEGSNGDICRLSCFLSDGRSLLKPALHSSLLRWSSQCSRAMSRILTYLAQGESLCLWRGTECSMSLEKNGAVTSKGFHTVDATGGPWGHRRKDWRAPGDTGRGLGIHQSPPAYNWTHRSPSYTPKNMHIFCLGLPLTCDHWGVHWEALSQGRRVGKTQQQTCLWVPETLRRHYYKGKGGDGWKRQVLSVLGKSIFLE